MSNLRSNQGMSFEERSDDEDGDGGSSSSSSDGVFQSSHNDQQRILISSTNDIAMFTDVPNYKNLNTVGISVFMIILAVGVFIVAAIVPFECDKRHLPVNGSYHHHHKQDDLGVTPDWKGPGKGHPICFMRPVSLLLYMHCILWAIFMLCDQFIRYQHAKIRRRGYLDFFNEVHTASQLPFWIVSAWSVLLLAVSSVLHDHCKSATDCTSKSIHLTRTEYLTICFGLETLALLVVLSSYIYQIWRFNKSRYPPDVFRDDMMSCALDYAHNSMGQMEEEVFQRQADLIRFFQERNVVLQKAVLQLNNRIHAVEAGGAGAIHS